MKNRIVAALLRCCVAALRRPQRASGNGEGGALRFWANYVPVPAAGCRPPARLGLAGPAGMLGLLLAADVGGEQVRSGLHGAARAARALQAVTDRWAISSCARGRGAGGRCAPCCGSLQPAGGGGTAEDDGAQSDSWGVYCSHPRCVLP